MGMVAPMGRHDDALARVYWEEWLALRRQLKDLVGVGSLLNNLAILAGDSGDNARARALFEEALALKRQIGDGSNVALGLNNLGDLDVVHGDLTRAAQLYVDVRALTQPFNHLPTPPHPPHYSLSL